MKINIFKRYLLEMICFFTLMFGYYFMLHDRLKQWFQFKKEQVFLIESLSRKKIQYVEHQKIISRLKNKRSLYQLEFDRLYRPIDGVAFFDQWVRLAIPFPLRWESIQRLPSQQQGSLILESFEIRLQGNYFDLLQFMQESLRLPYLLSFRTMHFSHTTASVQWEAKVYVYHRSS
ncbi:MAG: hypothetical protein A3F17_08135 [Gammaproteobacteria bacterium RIFCSPHIGHO2_12_FULL_41_15]|nr:MAG: hypothetical protein A3F17_08135 [Gammaproteobacteria bacterium RIFCSPHIGHO2_12_FULL_41_15]